VPFNGSNNPSVKWLILPKHPGRIAALFKKMAEHAGLPRTLFYVNKAALCKVDEITHLDPRAGHVVNFNESFVE